jgi:hypothetical protein
MNDMFEVKNQERKIVLNAINYPKEDAKYIAGNFGKNDLQEYKRIIKDRYILHRFPNGVFHVKIQPLIMTLNDDTCRIYGWLDTDGVNIPNDIVISDRILLQRNLSEYHLYEKVCIRDNRLIIVFGRHYEYDRVFSPVIGRYDRYNASIIKNETTRSFDDPNLIENGPKGGLFSIFGKKPEPIVISGIDKMYYQLDVTFTL